MAETISPRPEFPYRAGHRRMRALRRLQIDRRCAKVGIAAGKSPRRQAGAGFIRLVRNLREPAAFS